MKETTQIQNLPSELFKTWFHSREEDAEGLKVYRVENFNFPPSRFREEMEIEDNGEFIVTVPGTTDGRQEMIGTWTASEGNKISVTFSEMKPQDQYQSLLKPYTLEIVSVDEEVLKVRKS